MIKRLGLFLLVLAAGAQDENSTYTLFKGKAGPELVSEKEHWINAKEPIKLEKLKGKVVWLEFSFLS